MSQDSQLLTPGPSVSRKLSWTKRLFRRSESKSKPNELILVPLFCDDAKDGHVYDNYFFTSSSLPHGDSTPGAPVLSSDISPMVDPLPGEISETIFSMAHAMHGQHLPFDSKEHEECVTAAAKLYTEHLEEPNSPSQDPSISDPSSTLEPSQTQTEATKVSSYQVLVHHASQDNWTAYRQVQENKPDLDSNCVNFAIKVIQPFPKCNAITISAYLPGSSPTETGILPTHTAEAIFKLWKWEQESVTHEGFKKMALEDIYEVYAKAVSRMRLAISCIIPKSKSCPVMPTEEIIWNGLRATVSIALDDEAKTISAIVEYFGGLSSEILPTSVIPRAL
ncbi:hypothetical protein TREMEDRAFT_60805 [Tremella mesenterica DSM 1558]|uniref:uncharacterized protein n=1 Tax=Tremella mesenterica (strain ATCC 24925 / CBS 8224 / DSM 1558 / NBRC 9311 / NRRL Y-6157 / RJB 2259-6 / UBC 559-6) TaxID=578456 RepID=UPI0003F49658|nr:uncharacterized protein TREMEDRAFT_60805 [Tremella mesenterica DSM 1558]EIW71882.1 hypothetical protein TREMEDRAFT_60805 [Tremella mesenterica DSM 1558]